MVYIDCTGGYDKRLHEKNLLGLHRFHGYPPRRTVAEEQGIISADRIRTHTRTGKFMVFNIGFSIFRKLFFEAPRSKLRGIFDRKDFLSVFNSLAHSNASSGDCARYFGSRL